MAIQSIPETVQKQARGTHSLSSFQDNDEENQHGRESGYVSTNVIIHYILIRVNTFLKHQYIFIGSYCKFN